MKDEFTTWRGAMRAAADRALMSGKKHRVFSTHKVRGWAICPSRRWYVLEVQS